jgi:tRNA1Val (adenine37-N6)-methyltransferase
MSDSFFHFQHFSLKNKDAAFKINTDGVLLGAWVDVSEDQSILDIGTGTGVIAHICHYRNPKAQITGIDIDASSCKEALFNVNQNNYSIHISVINDDVKKWNPDTSFDHIISNPPYFKDGTKPVDSKLSSAKHSIDLPTEALWHSINRLAHSESKVSLIAPYFDLDNYLKMADAVGFYPKRILKIKNRSAGRYIRAAMEFGRISCETKYEELVIHSDGEAYYSDAFIELHKDLNMIFKR